MRGLLTECEGASLLCATARGSPRGRLSPPSYAVFTVFTEIAHTAGEKPAQPLRPGPAPRTLAWCRPGVALPRDRVRGAAPRRAWTRRPPTGRPHAESPGTEHHPGIAAARSAGLRHRTVDDPVPFSSHPRAGREPGDGCSGVGQSGADATAGRRRACRRGRLPGVRWRRRSASARFRTSCRKRPEHRAPSPYSGVPVRAPTSRAVPGSLPRPRAPRSRTGPAGDSEGERTPTGPDRPRHGPVPGTAPRARCLRGDFPPPHPSPPRAPPRSAPRKPPRSPRRVSARASPPSGTRRRPHWPCTHARHGRSVHRR